MMIVIIEFLFGFFIGAFAAMAIWLILVHALAVVIH